MKLWKDNMLNQEWELSNEEIIKKFVESTQYQDFKEGGLHLRTALSLFISSKSGLSSVFETDEFDALTEAFMAWEDEGEKG